MPIHENMQDEQLADLERRLASLEKEMADVARFFEAIIEKDKVRSEEIASLVARCTQLADGLGMVADNGTRLNEIVEAILVRLKLGT